MDGSQHGPLRRSEGGDHSVTGVLEQSSVVRLDRCGEHGVVGGQSQAHCVGVGLPTPRRALDVGEQEGHRA